MAKLAKSNKPHKPYRSFPLTAHNNGQWCKKIRGKVHFFGVWADPQAALDKYLGVAADLHAGKHPLQATLSPEGLIVKDICNRYLNHQLQKVLNAEIRASTFEDCRITVQSFAFYVGASRLDYESRMVGVVGHCVNIVIGPTDKGIIQRWPAGGG